MKPDKKVSKQQPKYSNAMDNIFLIHSNNEITKLNKGMSKKDVQQTFGGALNIVKMQQGLNDDVWLCTFGKNVQSKKYRLLFIDNMLAWVIRMG